MKDKYNKEKESKKEKLDSMNNNINNTITLLSAYVNKDIKNQLNKIYESNNNFYKKEIKRLETKEDKDEEEK